MTTQLLDVENLSVSFRAGEQRREALRGLSFSIGRAETLAIVGESGSGKSVTALAIMGLLPRGGRIDSGAIRLGGRDLVGAPPAAIARLRGAQMSMIFQEPMTSLNPVLSIAKQMIEGPIAHGRATARTETREAAAMLERVGITDPLRCLAQYPHELSGGMRQRVMIAAAMMMRPALLIADEPTTALDVTVQAQILDLLRALVRDEGTALVLVTHDMGVVAEMADRVLVMRRGEAVEDAAVRPLFAHPEATYTRALLAAVPRLDDGFESGGPPGGRSGGTPILVARGISRTFGGRRFFRQRSATRALDNVSLTLAKGEIVAVVGESGSGKSTLGRALARLTDVDAGEILFEGESLTALSGKKLRRRRSGIQMVFQDPYASLDPRFTIGRTIAEPMLVHGLATRAEAGERIAALLSRVQLDPGMASRYPHEFSGGQRQRVAIARALAARPRIIIADEPTSALDVSVQAQILDLIEELRRNEELSFVFISHDLAVVRRIADRVAVMRAGRVLELGPTGVVFREPAHVYTRALLSAVPAPDPDLRGRPRIHIAAGSYPAGRLVERAPNHWVAS
ncbi:glutathione transport system ATP-binding protein [Kaistia soli DSM 19436]|uniref:Glutathione transport system ATP-binding protein n=1 Tax=Kaistia soli DSM 19436 TaxID=1122133 RepID=A0A1M5L9Q7_9HYPH|nr:ABC transporter ATP-binding protein [Kaistia soli]SHG61738.1 glutathione transport system ATP-binding protein [Kaistia soli DSM 19436]